MNNFCNFQDFAKSQRFCNSYFFSIILFYESIIIVISITRLICKNLMGPIIVIYFSFQEAGLTLNGLVLSLVSILLIIVIMQALHFHSMKNIMSKTLKNSRFYPRSGYANLIESPSPMSCQRRNSGPAVLQVNSETKSGLGAIPKRRGKDILSAESKKQFARTLNKMKKEEKDSQENIELDSLGEGISSSKQELCVQKKIVSFHASMENFKSYSMVLFIQSKIFILVNFESLKIPN